MILMINQILEILHRTEIYLLFSGSFYRRTKRFQKFNFLFKIMFDWMKYQIKIQFIKHLKNEKGTGESPFRDKVLVIETLSLEVYLWYIYCLCPLKFKQLCSGISWSARNSIAYQILFYNVRTQCCGHVWNFN